MQDIMDGVLSGETLTAIVVNNGGAMIKDLGRFANQSDVDTKINDLSTRIKDVQDTLRSLQKKVDGIIAKESKKNNDDVRMMVTGMAMQGLLAAGEDPTIVNGWAHKLASNMIKKIK